THTRDAGNPDTALDQPKCSNPIPLEIAGLQPVRTRAELGTGSYELESIRFHRVYQETNVSFTVSAAAAGGDFEARIECNGAPNLGNAVRVEHVTNADGTT